MKKRDSTIREAKTKALLVAKWNHKKKVIYTLCFYFIATSEEKSKDSFLYVSVKRIEMFGR